MDSLSFSLKQALKAALCVNCGAFQVHRSRQDCIVYLKAANETLRAMVKDAATARGMRK